jgi:hypothetical protein
MKVGLEAVFIERRVFATAILAQTHYGQAGGFKHDGKLGFG